MIVELDVVEVNCATYLVIHSYVAPSPILGGAKIGSLGGVADQVVG